MSNIKTVALKAMTRATWSNQMRHVFVDFFNNAKEATFEEEWTTLRNRYVDDDHPQYAPLFAYVEKNILPDKKCFCRAWVDKGVNACEYVGVKGRWNA